MGFLSRYSATQRLPLGDGFWVDVRPFLSAKQKALAEAVLITPEMSMAVAGDGQKSDATPSIKSRMDTGGYQLETAAQAIVAWNLTDEHDNPLPLEPDEARRQSVGRLPGFVVDRIVKAVNEADKQSAQERASFPGGGEAGDPAEPAWSA